MENKDVGNNPSKGKQFRCSEVGPASCNWSVTGSSEQEILPKIEQHGREAHGINKMDDSMKKRVHEAIHDRAA